MTGLRNDGLRLTAAILAVMIGAPAIRAAGSGNAVVGDQRRWALTFRERLEQAEEQLPAAVDLSGALVSTICAVRPGEYDAELEIAGARLLGGVVESEPPAAREELRRRLARRFWATYRQDGALLTVHFYKDVNPADRNLLQMILTETQLVRPNQSKPTWTVLERDGAGSYLAIYQQAESNVLMKRRLKYVQIDGVSGAPAGGLQVAVDRSELRFALDPVGEVMALDGTDRVRIGVAFGNGGQLAATAEVHLAGLRRSRAPESIGSLARALPDVVSLAVVTHNLDPELARAQRDASLLEGRTTESLLEAATAASDDRVLPDRLAALFRRRPEAAGAALARLQKTGPQKRITAALGTAGSPAAIEALGRLARDRAASASARVDALTGLALTKHPSPQAMRISVALLDDEDAQVESAARIVSGALARAGRAEHAREAEEIDAALIARYRKAVKAQEISEVLSGLGNSAGPQALAVIEEALRDPRASLRAAAVRALRLAPGSKVDGLLSAAIAADPDASVRDGAIFAAGFRRPLGAALGEALLRAARADAVDYVRGDAIALLRHNPDDSPRIVETLTWIAGNDAKPSIRRLAREALESGRSAR